MKKIVFLLFLFLSFTVADAYIVSTPSTLNFDGVGVGQTKSETFVISNTAPVAVTNVYLSVYSSVFTLDKTYIPSIPPNGTVVVTVTFFPVEARFYESEVVIKRDPINSSDVNLVTKVYLKGNSAISPTISISPSSINFGNVSTGEKKVETLIIKNTGNVEVNNLRVTSSAGYFIVEPTMVDRILPGASAYVTVSFIPPTKGIFDGQLFLVYNGMVNPVTVSITARSDYATGLEVNPLFIDFGVVPVGSSTQNTFVLKNNGNGVINIDISVPPTMPFSVSHNSISLRPGQREVVTVVFNPVNEGTYRTYLLLKTDDKNAPKIDVEVVGYTSKGTILQSDVSSLNFGYVFLKTSKEKFIRVTNTSTTTVTATLTQEGDTAFTTPYLNQSLVFAPNETKIIPVKFSPTEKKIYSSVFVLTISPNTTFKIAATGFGDDGFVDGLPQPVPPPQSPSGSGGGGCSIVRSNSKSFDISVLFSFFLFTIFILYKRSKA